MKKELDGIKASKVDLVWILNNPLGKRGDKVTFDPKQVYDFELRKRLMREDPAEKLGSAIESDSRSIEADMLTQTAYRDDPGL